MVMTVNLLPPGEYANRILTRIKKANASGSIHKNDVLYVKRTLKTMNQATLTYWHQSVPVCRDTLTTRAFVYGSEFVYAYADDFGINAYYDF
jgi:hypothetical protein